MDKIDGATSHSWLAAPSGLMAMKSVVIIPGKPRSRRGSLIREEMNMWTKQCTAQTLRKKQCKRRSLWAIWTWRHQGESFKSPVWVELCGHHLHFDGVVSTMDIRHHTKATS